jgi:hypothetical protein
MLMLIIHALLNHHPLLAEPIIHSSLNHHPLHRTMLTIITQVTQA